MPVGFIPVGLVIGIGGGLASALLFYSAAHGSPLLGTALLLLTPLPSLLAGLGWGWMSAIAGGVAGALAMGFTTNANFAAGYFLALGVPAALFPYLASLSRAEADDPDRREWYPAGRIVAAVALYGGALPVLVLPFIGGSYEALRAPLSDFLRRVSTRAPELGLRGLSDGQIEAVAELVVALLPGALAAYWTAIVSLNLYVAGRIVRASGRLGRDWPDLPGMTFPPGFPLLVALAIAASLAPGTAGIAGTSFSGALLFAYLLAGLALMHFIAKVRAPWLLWIVYAALFLFGPYAGIALVVAGLLDPALNLRRRFGTAPPTT